MYLLSLKTRKPFLLNEEIFKSEGIHYMIHKELIHLVRYILPLREDLIIRAFDEKLIENDRNSNENIVLLFFNWNKLNFHLILSDFIIIK